MDKDSTVNNCALFRPNWDHSNSMDHNDPFHSALSSMVSSPTAASNSNNGQNIVLRELIGRLGTFCNSGHLSPFNTTATTTSCYSTPLNSPPKLNLSNHHHHFLSLPTLSPFSADPAFVADRAARFSCLAIDELDPIKIPGSHPHTVEESCEAGDNSPPENADSRENSTLSEQIQNPRKRKSAPKGKGKAPNVVAAAAAASENSESSAKRSSSEEEKEGAKANQKQLKDNSEPPKDYIHVRARRGQATDAHSLAERVRREKISERMKFLQDLVPGCNKVTGKAVMLDEIINYVQSLQRQVEFLSMKLATVNPRMDFNMEALMSKDMYQSRGSLPHSMYLSDGYPFQSQLMSEDNNLNGGVGRNQGIQFLPPMDNFGVSSFWEDDLHSIVQGFGQGETQNFEGNVPTAQMKVEL